MGCGMSCAKKEGLQNRVSVESSETIYHEKQSRELCALHALNNLFQQNNTYTKQSLDELCLNLSPDTYFNPHRSFLGLGNYDVNVIMAALQIKNLDTIWFDKRKDVGLLHVDNIYGFILNIPTDLKWGVIRLPIHRKHWITIREVDGKYYNLDSKLEAPETIGAESDLKVYLKEQILCKDKELLLVVQPSVASSGAWYKDAVDAKGTSQNGIINRTMKNSVSNTSSSSQSESGSSGQSTPTKTNTKNSNPETKV